MIRLPTSTWGHGPVAAVFLHGFTCSRHAFDHLEPLLGDVVTATCVDLPGHHGAPLPSQLGPEGFQETLEAVAALVPPGATLVGYSQGARVALGVAVTHPRLASHLVLESVSPGLRRRSERRQRRGLDEANALALETTGVESFVARWEQHPLFAPLRARPDDVQASVRALRLGQTAEGLAGALRCLGQGVQPDYWPSLPTLRTPTLLLAGALDEKYARLARRAAGELPLAWHALIPGSGHVPHAECPRAFADELRAFLAAATPDVFHRTQEIRA